jgi:hypothetical protein
MDAARCSFADSHAASARQSSSSPPHTHACCRAPSTGLFPDAALACDAACKLTWSRQWIRAHLRDALKLNKPLIIGGVGALRPQAWRAQLLALVEREMRRALRKGHPLGGGRRGGQRCVCVVGRVDPPACLCCFLLRRCVAVTALSLPGSLLAPRAGVLLSGVSHPAMPDASGWGVYFQAGGVQAARPALPHASAQVARCFEQVVAHSSVHSTAPRAPPHALPRPPSCAAIMPLPNRRWLISSGGGLCSTMRCWPAWPSTRPAQRR